MFRKQLRATKTLREYLDEEEVATQENLSSFPDEFEMADALFQAAQEVFASFPTSDNHLRRVQAGLLTASIRYFASSVNLCFRGNAGEAVSIMRTPIECMGYCVVITEKPELAQAWIDIDKLKNASERNAIFGSESSHREHAMLAEAASTYDNFSVFGTHARVPMTVDTIDYKHPGGWRLVHAEKAAKHTWLALGTVLFTMRDLIQNAMVPLLLEQPYPDELVRNLDQFERVRSVLGPKRQAFVTWAKNNPHIERYYTGAVLPIQLVPVFDRDPFKR